MKLWNGGKGAVSLTFDDGLACQAEQAIPMLNGHNLYGTFFIVAKNLSRCTDLWRAAAKSVHEMGSHSFGHFKARLVTTDEGRYSETVLSKAAIESTLDTKVESYAYPYAITDDPMMAAVCKVYKQARGGHCSPGQLFLRPTPDTNMFLTRSMNMCAGNIDSAYDLINTALASGTWLTFMFHGIGDATQFDNICAEKFETFLTHLDVARKQGLWVGTYGAVAQSMRDNWRK